MAQIDIRDIAIAYAGAKVIDGLSLTIADGSFFTLLGPSGCGKTTLLRTLAGFLPVDRGTIHFGAQDVTRLPAHRRDIGMVFQDYALFPDKTVFENVAYGLRARRKDEGTIRQRVGEYLERVGLDGLGQRRPAELSGGQRQRVALARALVIAPQALLMDEPLSNLDAKLRHQVRETIADLQREAGITTVFVTHDQEEALALSDHVGLMRQGRLEQIGRPEELYAAPVSGYVADFVGGANVLPVDVATPVDAGATLSVVLAQSRVPAIAGGALRAGPACLLARPEDIVLAHDAAAPALAGVIVRKQYLGARTRYRVRLGLAGPDIAVDVGGADHQRFRPADAVQVVFDPARTRVVAA